MKFAVLMMGLFCSLTAYAYQFVVEPGETQARKGEVVRAELMLTEVFIKPGMLPPANTQLLFISDASRISVPLLEDTEKNVLYGKAQAPVDGIFALLGVTSSVRPLVNRPGENLKVESFAKAYINLHLAEEKTFKPVGTRLEIIPLKSPASLVTGEFLPVRILFDGAPVSSGVVASYDGFSDEAHGYTTRAATADDGVAMIPLTSRGLWMIAAKVHRKEPGQGYSEYLASSTLVFHF